MYWAISQQLVIFWKKIGDLSAHKICRIGGDPEPRTLRLERQCPNRLHHLVPLYIYYYKKLASSKQTCLNRLTKCTRSTVRWAFCLLDL